METLHVHSRKASAEAIKSKSSDGTFIASKKNQLLSVANDLQHKYDQVKMLHLNWIGRNDMPRAVRDAIDEFIDQITEKDKQLRDIEKELSKMKGRKEQYAAPVDAIVFKEGKKTVDLRALKVAVSICGDANNPASHFDTYLHKLKSHGARQEWSEDNYVEALDTTLDGEVHQLFWSLKNDGNSLNDILEVMQSNYAKDTSSAEYHRQLHNFRRNPKDSIKATMAKFKILLSKTQHLHEDGFQKERIPIEMKNCLMQIMADGAYEQVNREIDQADAEGYDLDYETLEKRAMAIEKKKSLTPNPKPKKVELCVHAKASRHPHKPPNDEISEAAHSLQAAVTKFNRPGREGKMEIPNLRDRLDDILHKTKKAKVTFGKGKSKEHSRRGGMEVDNDDFLHQSQKAIPGAHASTQSSGAYEKKSSFGMEQDRRSRRDGSRDRDRRFSSERRDSSRTRDRTLERIKDLHRDWQKSGKKSSFTNFIGRGEYRRSVSRDRDRRDDSRDRRGFKEKQYPKKGGRRDNRSGSRNREIHTSNPITASSHANGPTHINLEYYISYKPEDVPKGTFYCHWCKNPESHNRKDCISRVINQLDTKKSKGRFSRKKGEKYSKSDDQSKN
jgi:hypothetical protein